ncbi:AP2 domain transcription factor AP2VIIa-9 [Besnoitia besnoiti]|uniref:AP2 domain transcription factor AP2VIIa-9 n=1 Tax=Besnoitia besnoiti TaxID=94643 RepID=A0A2A9M6K5_BESBE|nr:AP2 domain transcription factor AP2VIIa-9 [Besnoitia besnoiti]PFH31273.1 AP2 domain transcription factor AP2VIIa-9 [Besnoitia besnoiti]
METDVGDISVRFPLLTSCERDPMIQSRKVTSDASRRNDGDLPGKLRSQCAQALVWALFEQPTHLAGVLQQPLSAPSEIISSADASCAFSAERRGCASIGGKSSTQPCRSIAACSTTRETTVGREQDECSPLSEGVSCTHEMELKPTFFGRGPNLPALVRKHQSESFSVPPCLELPGSAPEGSGDNCLGRDRSASGAPTLEQFFVELRTAVERRLQSIDAMVEQCAGAVADTYGQLTMLAADLDDLAGILRQEHGVASDSSEHQDGEPSPTRSREQQATRMGAAGDGGGTDDVSGVSPVDAHRSPEMRRALTSAVSTNFKNELPTDSGSAVARDSVAGVSLAATTTTSAYPALLSAPIIPRAAQRPRWWRGEHAGGGASDETLHRHIFHEGYRQDDADLTTGRRAGVAVEPRGNDAADAGVHFDDGQQSDSYGTDSRDFFCLTDVLAPFIDGPPPRGQCDKNASEAAEIISAEPDAALRPCVGVSRQAASDGTDVTEYACTSESTKPENQEDEAKRAGLEDGERLRYLLKGGGGVTRWCSSASRMVGDFKPSTRRHAALHRGAPPECETPVLKSDETRSVVRSEPTRGPPVSSPVTPAWLPPLSSSCVVGIPSLLLPRNFRRPQDPTRPKPADGDSLGEATGPATGAPARAPNGAQSSEWACGGTEAQTGLRYGESESRTSPYVASQRFFRQATGLSVRSEERLRHDGLSSEVQGSCARASPAGLEGKLGTPKAKCGPAGSTTMGATMAFPYVKGVTYNRIKKYWIAQWIENGHSKVKYFSTFKYGDETAHSLAVEWRMKHTGHPSTPDDRLSQPRGDTGCRTGVAGVAPDNSEYSSGGGSRAERRTVASSTSFEGQDRANEDCESFSAPRARGSSGLQTARRNASGRGAWLMRAGSAGSTSAGEKKEEAKNQGGASGGRQLPPHRSNGIVGVSFSRTSNAWLAYIKNRVTKTQLNRYFKVNVYGFRLAKKKAIEARLELEERMRNSNQSGWDAFSDRKSLAVGVYYEDEKDSWVACCRDPRTGEGIYRFFPVSECPGGDLEARAKAIDARMDMDDFLGADDEQSLAQRAVDAPLRKRKRKTENEEAPAPSSEEGRACDHGSKRRVQEAVQRDPDEKRPLSAIRDQTERCASSADPPHAAQEEHESAGPGVQERAVVGVISCDLSKSPSSEGILHGRQGGKCTTKSRRVRGSCDGDSSGATEDATSAVSREGDDSSKDKHENGNPSDENGDAASPVSECPMVSALAHSVGRKCQSEVNGSHTECLESARRGGGGDTPASGSVI